MRILALFASLGACLLTASAASAQDVETDDGTARSFYEAGLASYESERFGAALSAFEQAYELSGRPEFLFNMARSLDRLHRTEEALDMYQRYAEEEPDSEELVLVERRIQILNEELESPAVANADSDTATRSGFLSAPALAGFGVGALGLLTFAVSGAISKSRFNELEDTCAPFCDEDEGTAERAALIADVGLGVGIAGLVFGLVYALVAESSEREPESGSVAAALSVYPTRDGAAVQLARSF